MPIISTSNDTSLCLGDSINIYAFGGVTYVWTTTNSISNTTVSNPNIWPHSNTIYYVIGTGANNCSDTAEISITVNSLPIVFAGVNQELCFGDTVILT